MSKGRSSSPRGLPPVFTEPGPWGAVIPECPEGGCCWCLSLATGIEGEGMGVRTVASRLTGLGLKAVPTGLDVFLLLSFLLILPSNSAIVEDEEKS